MPVQNSFVNGEIDDRILGRSETGQYFTALSKARNVICMPQGGIQRRPGLEFQADVGLVSALGAARLIPLEVSADVNFMVVMSADGNGSVYDQSDGTVVDTFTHPYTIQADFDDMTWAPDLGRLFLFTPNQYDRFLSEITPGVWDLTLSPYTNVPKVAFLDTTTGGVDHEEELFFVNVTTGDRFTLFLDGEESAVILTAGTGAGTAANIQVILRAMDITGAAGVVVTFLGGQSYLLNFATDDGKKEWTVFGGDSNYDDIDGAIFSHTTVKGNPDQEPAFDISPDSLRGNSRSGAFFQGRLMIGGTRDLPQSFIMSKSADVFDLNNRDTLDDFGALFDILTESVKVIRQIHVGRHVQIFTDKGEFYIPISEDEVLTPENTFIRQTTSRGIARGIPVVGVDGATLFIDASGKSLRELLFTDSEAAYDATDLSFLAPHLLRSPRAMAYHRSQDINRPDLLLIVNNTDNTLAIFATKRDQKVAGWSLCLTSGGDSAGGFYDVAVVNNEMWFLVIRDINGAGSKYYLERFNEKFTVDSAVGAFDLGAPVAAGTGLAHLNGHTCKVILDNTVQPDGVPAAGSLTFARSATDSWQVGLGWPIVDGASGIVQVEQLPIEVPDTSGQSTMGKKRRVSEVVMRVYETSDLYVEGKPVPFRSLGPSLLDVGLQKFTGLATVNGPEKQDEEGRISFTQQEHLPFTLLAVNRKV